MGRPPAAESLSLSLLLLGRLVWDFYSLEAMKQVSLTKVLRQKWSSAQDALHVFTLLMSSYLAASYGVRSTVDTLGEATQKTIPVELWDDHVYHLSSARQCKDDVLGNPVT